MDNELCLTLLGRPISKKNSKSLIKVKGRIIPISSKQYRAFEKDALKQLERAQTKFFSGKVFVNYVFYMKGKLSSDGDNLEAGINDILQKAGIIVDDKNITEWHGKKVEGCEDWKTEVTIKPL